MYIYLTDVYQLRQLGQLGHIMSFEINPAGTIPLRLTMLCRRLAKDERFTAEDILDSAAVEGMRVTIRKKGRVHPLARGTLSGDGNAILDWGDMPEEEYSAAMMVVDDTGYSIADLALMAHVSVFPAME